MTLATDIAQMVQLQQAALPLLNTGLLIFTRTFSFFHFAPIFNRKDLPVQVKITLVLFVTLTLLFVVPAPKNLPQGNMFIWLTIINIFVGSLFGIMLDVVLQVVIGAGAILNNQIGLSAANIFDPSRRTQTALLEGFFVFLVGATFISMNGLHWLIGFLLHSFTIFGLDDPLPNVFSKIDIVYFVNLTGDSLKVGVEMMAAAFIGTLLMDVILGVINRTAQQIPVFQISNSVKPVVGIAILLVTLPLFIDSVQHHITKHLQLFWPQ
jgi:flagellar biosynthetic protein FliR